MTGSSLKGWEGQEVPRLGQSNLRQRSRRLGFQGQVGVTLGEEGSEAKLERRVMGRAGLKGSEGGSESRGDDRVPRQGGPGTTVQDGSLDKGKVRPGWVTWD